MLHEGLRMTAWDSTCFVMFMDTIMHSVHHFTIVCSITFYSISLLQYSFQLLWFRAVWLVNILPHYCAGSNSKTAARFEMVSVGSESSTESDLFVLRVVTTVHVFHGTTVPAFSHIMLHVHVYTYIKLRMQLHYDHCHWMIWLVNAQQFFLNSRFGRLPEVQTLFAKYTLSLINPCACVYMF